VIFIYYTITKDYNSILIDSQSELSSCWSTDIELSMLEFVSLSSSAPTRNNDLRSLTSAATHFWYCNIYLLSRCLYKKTETAYKHKSETRWKAIDHWYKQNDKNWHSSLMLSKRFPLNMHYMWLLIYRHNQFAINILHVGVLVKGDYAVLISLSASVSHTHSFVRSLDMKFYPKWNDCCFAFNKIACHIFTALVQVDENTFR